MTDAQKPMTNNILAGPRTVIAGPFDVLLRSPEMGDLAQELGAYVRFDSLLPDTLREMSIIMTARHWTAPFEWCPITRGAAIRHSDTSVQPRSNGRPR